MTRRYAVGLDRGSTTVHATLVEQNRRSVRQAALDAEGNGRVLGVRLGSVAHLLDVRKVIDGVEIVQETRGDDVVRLGAARRVFERDEAAGG